MNDTTIMPFGMAADYVSKIGVNHTLTDAVNEFIDNSIDAIAKGCKINVEVNLTNNTPFIYDNGNGFMNVSVFDECMKIGGTSKLNDGKEIGKFGIGMKSAFACIAQKCIKDKDMPVYFTITSKSRITNEVFSKQVVFNPNGSTGLKNININPDNVRYGTLIEMENIEINDTMSKEIDEKIRETYALTITEFNLMNISVNGRKIIPMSSDIIFHGHNYIQENTNVGDNCEVEVRYILPSPNMQKSEKQTEKSALRFYSKETGRLITKNPSAWSWFGGRQIQPTVCGLRCGIFIPTDMETYKKFGINNGKNKINYALYCNDKLFDGLTAILKDVYLKASKIAKKNDECEKTVCNDGIRLTFSDKIKTKDAVIECEDGNFILSRNPSKMASMKLIALCLASGICLNKVNEAIVK